MEKQIRKTGMSNTYFEGSFFLRDDEKWAHPIDFPTVFVAFGRSVRSGNWKSCTGINTPDYVVDNYFNGKKLPSEVFWNAVEDLERVTWNHVNKNKQAVLTLIDVANNELSKLNLL